MRRWGETGGQDGSDRDNNVLGWACTEVLKEVGDVM